MLDYAPEFDASKYPRREMDIIIDPLLDGGGWATKVSLSTQAILGAYVLTTLGECDFYLPRK